MADLPQVIDDLVRVLPLKELGHVGVLEGARPGHGGHLGDRHPPASPPPPLPGCCGGYTEGLTGGLFASCDDAVTFCLQNFYGLKKFTNKY